MTGSSAGRARPADGFDGPRPRRHRRLDPAGHRSVPPGRRKRRASGSRGVVMRGAPDPGGCSGIGSDSRPIHALADDNRDFVVPSGMPRRPATSGPVIPRAWWKTRIAAAPRQRGTPDRTDRGRGPPCTRRSRPGRPSRAGRRWPRAAGHAGLGEQASTTFRWSHASKRSRSRRVASSRETVDERGLHRVPARPASRRIRCAMYMHRSATTRTRPPKASSSPCLARSTTDQKLIPLGSPRSGGVTEHERARRANCLDLAGARTQGSA